MAMVPIREHLRQQLEGLPDDILVEIADSVALILARRQAQPAYAEWSDRQWHSFALGQFLRESDEVEYTLADAEELYRR
jgi:hypothetical protein